MDTRNLDKLFDSYIPASLKTQDDFYTLVKAKILMGLYLSTTTIVIVTLALLLLVIPSSNPNWIHGLYAALLALLLVAIETLIFYKSENVDNSAIIFSMMFFTSSLTTVILTGGWQSPILLLFFCSPVVSFLVGGRREGLYITSLVLFCVTGLMIAYKLDFVLFQILAEENIESIRFAIWIASISLLVACLTTYDFLLESSIKQKRRVN